MNNRIEFICNQKSLCVSVTLTDLFYETYRNCRCIKRSENNYKCFKRSVESSNFRILFHNNCNSSIYLNRFNILSKCFIINIPYEKCSIYEINEYIDNIKRMLFVMSKELNNYLNDI